MAASSAVLIISDDSDVESVSAPLAPASTNKARPRRHGNRPGSDSGIDLDESVIIVSPEESNRSRRRNINLQGMSPILLSDTEETDASRQRTSSIARGSSHIDRSRGSRRRRSRSPVRQPSNSIEQDEAFARQLQQQQDLATRGFGISSPAVVHQSRRPHHRYRGGYSSSPRANSSRPFYYDAPQHLRTAPAASFMEDQDQDLASPQVSLYGMLQGALASAVGGGIFNGEWGSPTNFSHGPTRSAGPAAESPVGSYEELLALDDRIKKKGLSKDDLDRFTAQQTLQKSDIQKLSTQSCVICLDDFKPQTKIRRLPCLCCFHTRCIDKYLKDHTDCPICRQQVKTNS